MALVPLDMQLVAQGVNRLWIYNSADALGGAGYFNGMAHVLNVGDHIRQSDGTNARMYTVLTNDGSTVTVGAGSVT